jgi:hypothetical protein
MGRRGRAETATAESVAAPAVSRLRECGNGGAPQLQYHKEFGCKKLELHDVITAKLMMVEEVVQMGEGRSPSSLTSSPS